MALEPRILKIHNSFVDPMQPTTTEMSELHTTIERIASDFDETCDNTGVNTR